MLVGLIFTLAGLAAFGGGMALWSGSSVTEYDPNEGYGLGIAAGGMVLLIIGLAMVNAAP